MGPPDEPAPLPARRETRPGAAASAHDAAQSSGAPQTRLHTASGGDALAEALARAGPAARRVVAQASQRRLQILCSLVSGLPADDPLLGPPADAARLERTLGFRVDAEYLYPASVVKLPTALAAIAALRALADQTGRPIDPHTPLRFWPWDAPPAARAPRRRFTLADDLRRSLVVSDNPAHNRLYDLVGHAGLDAFARGVGLTRTIINHRLSAPAPREEHRRSGRVDVFAPGEPLTIPPRESPVIRQSEPVAGLLVGRAHVDPLDALRARAQGRAPVIIDAPMDFSWRNAMPVSEQHRLTIALAFPALAARVGVSLALRDDDRQRVLGLMATLPRQAGFSPRAFPDAWGKFMLPGLAGAGPVIYANKMGRAYGFSLDTAVLARPGRGEALVISAALYANDADELGTDRYDDAAIADPFFADLGRAAAAWLDRGLP